MRHPLRRPTVLAVALAVAAFWPLGAAPLVTCSACDTTFGVDGLATNLGIGPGLGSEVVVQDDGKALLAINQHVAGTAAVARVNGDGSLDATFGSGGVVALTFDADSDAQSAFGVALGDDLDGLGGPFDIVVAGRIEVTVEGGGGGGGGRGRGGNKSTTSTERYLAVARLNADGTAVTGVPPVRLEPEATQPGDQVMAIDSGGDILIGGRTGSTSVVFRVSADLSTVSTSEVASGVIGGLRVDSADRVVGQISNLGRVVRWTGGGQLDSTFGIGGVVDVSSVYQMAVDDADGVLVGARIRYQTKGRNKMEWDEFEVVRYDANGTLDTGFGTLVFDPRDVNDGRTLFVEDLEVDPEGRIVAALHAFQEDGNTRAAHIVRWDATSGQVLTYEPPFDGLTMWSVAFGTDGLGTDIMTLGGWDQNGPSDSIPALIRMIR